MFAAIASAQHQEVSALRVAPFSGEALRIDITANSMVHDFIVLGQWRSTSNAQSAPVTKAEARHKQASIDKNTALTS